MSNTTIREDFYEVNQYVRNIQEDAIHRKIIYVEYLSIFLTLACFILTTYLAFDDNSVTALAISVDTLLDVFAYIVCIWRYKKSSQQIGDKLKSEGYDKDQVASITLAILFLVSAFWVEMWSVKSFLTDEKPIESYIFIVIALFQSFIFSILAIIKFLLAQKLTNSSVILSDGINSLICSLSNLSMAVSMVLYITMDIYSFDSIFGFLIGVLIFVYGTQLLMNNCCFKDL